MQIMEERGINPLFPKDKACLKTQMDLIRASERLSQASKEQIAQFLVKCQGSGISTLRLVFYANRIRQVGEALGKDFKEASRQDFERVMAELQARDYKPHTMDAFIVSTKVFYRWLFSLDKGEALPKCVSWIERRKTPNTLKKEDLLTEEEVNVLIRRMPDPMIRIMIAVLYESAMRPEELRGMKLKDVHINTSTVKLYVRGKMSKEEGERVVFLARTYLLLKDWVQYHPYAGNPEAWLWPDHLNRNRPITDVAFRQALYRLARRALPGKKVWPYLFRHSTGTWIYKTFPTPIARRMMGHAPGSRMERVYVHLAEEDIETAIQTQYNLQGQEKPVSKGVCIKCGSILYLGDMVCRKCGLADNTRAAYEKDIEDQVANATMNILMGDPQIKGRILELRQGIREGLGLE